MNLLAGALVATLVLGTVSPPTFAAIHSFAASMDGAQETPPNGSLSMASGTFSLDDSSGIASFNIIITVPPASGEIAAHVHGPAGPGVPAGIVYSLPLGSPKISNSPVLTPQQQADMLAGLHYVNIHSAAFPGGEIRGQILLIGTTQMKPTKTLLVKNPPSGAANRKILWKVRETASSNTVTGDPTTGGATLRVALTPGGDQCFALPAGNWSVISSIGFKYKDADLSEGAVKVAQIKKTPSGNFLIKAILKGSGPQGITVMPGNATTSYAVNLKMGGGDAYCSGTGAALPSENTAATFKTGNDTTPASCAIEACP